MDFGAENVITSHPGRRTWEWHYVMPGVTDFARQVEAKKHSSALNNLAEDGLTQFTKYCTVAAAPVTGKRSEFSVMTIPEQGGEYLWLGTYKGPEFLAKAHTLEGLTEIVQTWKEHFKQDDHPTFNGAYSFGSR